MPALILAARWLPITNPNIQQLPLQLPDSSSAPKERPLQLKYCITHITAPMYKVLSLCIKYYP